MKAQDAAFPLTVASETLFLKQAEMIEYHIHFQSKALRFLKGS